MKNKSGYTPWVARSAPLFNTALNTTYIKVSMLIPIVFTSFLVGVITVFASQHQLSDLVNLAKPLLNAQVIEAASKPPINIAEKQEPVAIAPKVVTLVTPQGTTTELTTNPVQSNVPIVPAIPMTNSAVVDTAPKVIAPNMGVKR